MFFVLSKYLSKETFNVLASYYSWADRFESHFCIIIPRQGFRDGAHLLTPSTTKKSFSVWGYILWFTDLPLVEYCVISFNKIG